MSAPTDLHAAVKQGNLQALRALLEGQPRLANARSETDTSRPEVTRVLLEAGSDPQQRNKHGLTPLDCALGGAQGQWQRFSNASLEDWRRCVELLRS